MTASLHQPSIALSIILLCLSLAKSQESTFLPQPRAEAVPLSTTLNSPLPTLIVREPEMWTAIHELPLVCTTDTPELSHLMKNDFLYKPANYLCQGRCGSVASGDVACSCDSRCVLSHDCCEDVATSCPAEKEEGDRFTLEFESDIGGNIFPPGVEYHLVGYCPSNWTDMTIKSLCEDENAGSLNNISILTGNFTLKRPVFGSKNNLHYRNKYCAICHSEQGYQPWKPKILCQRGPFPKQLSLEQLVQNFLTWECYFEWDFLALINGTRPHEAATYPFTDCNHFCFDVELRDRCKESLGPIECYSFGQTTRYRNRFCANCEGGFQVETRCGVPYDSKHLRSMSLSSFFSLDKDGADILVQFQTEGMMGPSEPKLASEVCNTTLCLTGDGPWTPDIQETQCQVKLSLNIAQSGFEFKEIVKRIIDQLSVYFLDRNLPIWWSVTDNSVLANGTCLFNGTDETDFPAETIYYVHLANYILASQNFNFLRADANVIIHSIASNLSDVARIISISYVPDREEHFVFCPYLKSPTTTQNIPLPKLSVAEDVLLYIMTVLLVISIICLIIRLLFQCFKKSSRNMGDQLQAVLAALLLIFYMAFVIGTGIYANHLFDTTDVRHKVVQACGILAVWSLLTYFCCTNALSLHLYSIICAPLEMRRFSATYQWIKFLLHTFIPGTVISVVVISLDLCDVSAPWDPQFGICGPGICSRNPLILFLIIPQGVVLIGNSIAFAFIIKHIRKSARQSKYLQGHSSEGHYKKSLTALSIRLFIAMGIAWTAAFINVFTSRLILDYVATILLSSMGIIVLVSFLWRKSTCFNCDPSGTTVSKETGSSGTGSSGIRSLDLSPGNSTRRTNA